MKMIQIRDAPEQVHRTLKVRAAQEGVTLSEYLLREISSLATRPTAQDLAVRLRRRATFEARLDSAAEVRSLRGKAR